MEGWDKSGWPLLSFSWQPTLAVLFFHAGFFVWPVHQYVVVVVGSSGCMYGQCVLSTVVCVGVCAEQCDWRKCASLHLCFL